MTEKDIKDLYEVRIALETAILRHITPKLSKAELRKIETIYQKGKGAIKADDRLGYMRIDREFHLYLAKLTSNRYMITSLENIRDLIDWMVFKALTRSQRMEEVKREHERVIERLKERDTPRAIRMMEEHIRITEQNVLQWFKT